MHLVAKVWRRTWKLNFSIPFLMRNASKKVRNVLTSTIFSLPLKKNISGHDGDSSFITAKSDFEMGIHLRDVFVFGVESNSFDFPEPDKSFL